MVTQSETLKGYLALSRAAARAGVSEATLRGWAKSGKVAALVTPHGRLFREDVIERIARERARNDQD